MSNDDAYARAMGHPAVHVPARFLATGQRPAPRDLCPGFVNPHIDPFPARCVLGRNHDGDCA